jgi:hypothetical protein
MTSLFLSETLLCSGGTQFKGALSRQSLSTEGIEKMNCSRWNYDGQCFCGTRHFAISAGHGKITGLE